MTYILSWQKSFFVSVSAYSIAAAYLILLEQKCPPLLTGSLMQMVRGGGGGFIRFRFQNVRYHHSEDNCFLGFSDGAEVSELPYCFCSSSPFVRGWPRGGRDLFQPHTL